MITNIITSIVGGSRRFNNHFEGRIRIMLDSILIRKVKSGSNHLPKGS